MRENRTYGLMRGAGETGNGGAGLYSTVPRVAPFAATGRRGRNIPELRGAGVRSVARARGSPGARGGPWHLRFYPTSGEPFQRLPIQAGNLKDSFHIHAARKHRLRGFELRFSGALGPASFETLIQAFFS